MRGSRCEGKFISGPHLPQATGGSGEEPRGDNHTVGRPVIPGGGGLLSLEKGTDCGPTAAELWLSRAKIAKNEGLSSHYECA